MCLGKMLMLTCVTDEQFLEWNITIPSQTDYVRTRLVSSSEIRDIPPLTMNYTIFSFHRESRVPLNITLTITNATVDMKILCIEYHEHDSLSSAYFTRVNIVSSKSDVSCKSLTISRAYINLLWSYQQCTSVVLILS